MKLPKQKVVCIGSMGKDVFFPVSSGTIVESQKDSRQQKQFCFGYGGKVHVEDRFIALGGCACNVSIGLARLGIDSVAVGNIGDDAEGIWIQDTLAMENVTVDKIRTIKQAHTDLSVIIVDTHTGERTIFVNRDVGEKLVVQKNDLSGFDWCFVGSLYGKHIESNMHIFHDALVRGDIKLAYNPGGKNIIDNENIVLDLIHHASVVFVNKSEACAIVSKFNLPYNKNDLQSENYLLAILKEHMRDSKGVVVLTDGRRGAWVCDGDAIYHTKTIDKPVHDATGAGDAFASGFLGGMVYALPIARCVQWGSVNGDSVVDYYGAQEGLQTYDGMQKRCKLFPVENKTKK